YLDTQGRHGQRGGLQAKVTTHQRSSQRPGNPCLSLQAAIQGADLGYKGFQPTQILQSDVDHPLKGTVRAQAQVGAGSALGTDACVSDVRLQEGELATGLPIALLQRTSQSGNWPVEALGAAALLFLYVGTGQCAGVRGKQDDAAGAGIHRELHDRSGHFTGYADIGAEFALQRRTGREPGKQGGRELYGLPG